MTIEEIANELGVSKSTVSRALSGKGRIGKATVERIQAYVAAHDNLPNQYGDCLLYTSPSPRDAHESRMPSSA